MTEVRMARCTYFKGCGSEAPSSSPHLAFFQDKTQPQPGCAAPGTNARGQCGYHKVAHEYSEQRVRKEPVVKHEFVSQTEGEAHDEYYCGCYGWD